MKQFEIQEFGIDKLALVERPVPTPEPTEVLIKLRAASLNFRDYLTVQGTYNAKMRLPLVPLSDGVGVIEAVGPEVTRFKVGDRVAGCFMQRWHDGPVSREKAKSSLGGPNDGMLREYVVLSEAGLVAVPPDLTDEQAAALPCAGVTAWHALFEHTPLPPGSSVLLQGTGGVSIFALQFGVAAGFRMIVTSSSDAKLARARELGASETINYRENPEWDKEVRRLTNGEGADHVIEVGGSGTLAASLRAIRVAGVISVIGALSGADPTVSPVPILMNSIRLQGLYVGSRAMFERMNQAIVLHGIRPIVHQTFAWTDIKEALRAMQSQQHFGKLCLKF